MIMLRTLHKDISRYNQIDSGEDAQEEFGWKLVHGDVFRPPRKGMLLSVFLGSGTQVFCMTLVTLGKYSPQKNVRVKKFFPICRKKISQSKKRIQVKCDVIFLIILFFIFSICLSWIFITREQRSINDMRTSFIRLSGHSSRLRLS